MATFPGRTRGAGFTLVEMLVAIALISALVAITFPVVRSLREGTQSAGCVNQLRKLGDAIFNYANDHNQLLVPGLYREDGLSIPWSRVLNGVGLPKDYLGIPYPPTELAKATRKSAFDCPARETPATYDHLHYGLSVYIGFFTYDDAGTGLKVYLPQIESAPRTLLVGEVSNAYRLMPYNVSTIVLPHKGGMNALYADGSVRRVAGPLKNANVALPGPQPPFF